MQKTPCRALGLVLGLGAETWPRPPEVMEIVSPPPSGGGSETTRGEPLPEGHASSTARAEEIIGKPSVAENVQKGAESTMTRQQLLPGKQRFLAGRLPHVLHLFLLFFLALVASLGFSICLRLSFLCNSLALPYVAP